MVAWLQALFNAEQQAKTTHDALEDSRQQLEQDILELRADMDALKESSERKVAHLAEELQAATARADAAADAERRAKVRRA